MIDFTNSVSILLPDQRLEVAAKQTKPSCVGFKPLIFHESTHHLELVCVVVNYIRPKFFKGPLFQTTRTKSSYFIVELPLSKLNCSKFVVIMVMPSSVKIT